MNKADVEQQLRRKMRMQKNANNRIPKFDNYEIDWKDDKSGDGAL